MKKHLKKFAQDTSGAITVDWVVLCAGVVALAAVAVTSISTGSEELSDNVGVYITTQDFF